MAAKTASVRIPILHFIRQNKGCVTMAIIQLPQPIHNNLSATRPQFSLARLKSATATGKIKESSKVLAKVRLFRLLPKITNFPLSPTPPRCAPATFPSTFLVEFASGR
jgi:hypothetical protein